MQMSCVISDFSLWFLLWPASFYLLGMYHKPKTFSPHPHHVWVWVGVHLVTLEDSITFNLETTVTGHAWSYIKWIGWESRSRTEMVVECVWRVFVCCTMFQAVLLPWYFLHVNATRLMDSAAKLDEAQKKSFYSKSRKIYMFNPMIFHEYSPISNNISVKKNFLHFPDRKITIHDLLSCHVVNILFVLFASFHSFCHTSDIMVCLVSSLDWDWFGTILCHNQIPLLLSLPCLVSRKQAVQSEDHLRIWPGWWADKPISDQSFSHLPPPPTFLTFWSPLFCLLSSSIFTHTSSQHSHASLIELTVYFSWICFVG